MNGCGEEPVFETPSPVRKRFNEWFLYPTLNYVLPNFICKPVLRRCGSPIVHESFKNPGSWRVMNLFYEKRKGCGWIHFLMRESSMAMGLRNRKKMVVDNLIRLFQKVKKESLLVMGVGTGPAIMIMEAIRQAPAKRVKAFCVDLDDSAFPYGEKLKTEWGLEENVEFIHSDARHAMEELPDKPSVIEIVGLMEYLDDLHVKQLCDFAFCNLEPGGVLMANSIVANHGVKGFVEKIFALKLNYRDENKLMRFMEASGFKSFRVEREPVGIYSLVMAEKRE